MDITLAPWTPDSPVSAGPMVLHHPACSVVVALRAQHKPLLTMFDVDCDLDELKLPRHHCLDSSQEPGR